MSRTDNPSLLLPVLEHPAGHVAAIVQDWAGEERTIPAGQSFPTWVIRLDDWHYIEQARGMVWFWNELDATFFIDTQDASVQARLSVRPGAPFYVGGHA